MIEPLSLSRPSWADQRIKSFASRSSWCPDLLPLLLIQMRSLISVTGAFAALLAVVGSATAQGLVDATWPACRSRLSALTLGASTNYVFVCRNVPASYTVNLYTVTASSAILSVRAFNTTNYNAWTAGSVAECLSSSSCYSFRNFNGSTNIVATSLQTGDLYFVVENIVQGAVTMFVDYEGNSLSAFVLPCASASHACVCSQ